MDNNNYYAFLESILLTDPELSFQEKMDIEEELVAYYADLAFLESQMADSNLSDDQKETAYQEYAELLGTI
jgi:hypothetical protein